MNHDITRRKFMRAAAGMPALAIGAGVLGGRQTTRIAPTDTLTRVDNLPAGVTRTWLAPQYWSNRLADWQLADGRIESLTAVHGGQTVAVLTRNVAPGDFTGTISVRTGTLETGTGFSGFVIGAGAGALDWRAAALVMAASGQGGGFLATYESDGNVRFRDHTSETNQFSYEELPADNRSGPAPARTSDEDVVLQLDFAPAGDGTFVLTLTATRFDDGMMLSQASRSGFVDAEPIGQISLMSTAHAGGTTARYWFQELQTGGEKIAEQPHSIGPIAGTLYSLNGSTLKLTAQFMPIGSADPQRATLEKRAPGTTTWTRVQSVTIGDGYVALFQVNDWKSDLPWDFRVTWATGTEQATSYPGRIRRDPKRARQLKVGIVNCAIHSFRLLTRKSSGAPELPGERFLGLYTRANLYFPYSEAATNLIRHNPDLLVAAGDQYYDHKLIPADYSGDILDALYRWCLWLLSFGALTRGRPTICLVDDHDVYQQNLWGWVGRAAPRDNFRYGGYTMPPTWINTVQRMQCSHNPDAYDPTPVQQGITVYYAAFSYGSVSFALLEDRKFKNTNQFGHDPSGRPLPPPRQLLGRRQENFLSAWVDMHPGQPKVCLTQTPYACIQTDPAGQPVMDPDSNGSPVPARRRALKLLREAHALILSGDQHCSTLIRHGIDAFDDGPINFTTPAVGSAFQRWFTPDHALPNARGEDTGDFTDGYGNRFRVLAVANPKISYATVHSIHPHDNDIGNQNLKCEGYGIVHIDKAAKVYRIECWPWHTDPTAPGASQFAGWPFTVSFSDVGGSPT